MTQVVVISYSSPFNLFIARTNLTKIGMWYDSNWKLFFLEFSCHELSYNRKLLTFVVTTSYEEPILFVTLEYFWKEKNMQYNVLFIALFVSTTNTISIHIMRPYLIDVLNHATMSIWWNCKKYIMKFRA